MRPSKLTARSIVDGDGEAPGLPGLPAVLPIFDVAARVPEAVSHAAVESNLGLDAPA